MLVGAIFYFYCYFDKSMRDQVTVAPGARILGVVTGHIPHLDISKKLV